MFKQIRNCFGKDPVNTGRQHELDVAKGFIIIFMALSHAIEILGWFFDPALSDGFFWHGFDMVMQHSRSEKSSRGERFCLFCFHYLCQFPCSSQSH